jgi:hypothetical protein
MFTSIILPLKGSVPEICRITTGKFPQLCGAPGAYRFVILIMTPQEAKSRLAELRHQSKKIKEEIDFVKAILTDAGLHPNRPDNTARDAAIFGMRNRGGTYTGIGKHFGLSPTRIKNIITKMVKAKMRK